MTPDRVARAAEALIAARETVVQIAALPEGCRPANADEGYHIQDRVAAQLGHDLAGWKIGCTSLDQQQELGVDEPFAGRLFAPLVQDSPAIYSASAFAMRGIEVEFAFRLGADLPPRAAPYGRDEVAAAVAALHPAIEIVDSRFRNWRSIGIPNLIADNGVNGGFVFAPGEEEWRHRDLANHAASLTIDGAHVAEGLGSRVLGHPLNALVWLANDRSRRGYGLSAGQFVSTGTCLGVHFVDAGAEIVADFGDLGRVELRFTG